MGVALDTEAGNRRMRLRTGLLNSCMLPSETELTEAIPLSIVHPLGALFPRGAQGVLSKSLASATPRRLGASGRFVSELAAPYAEAHEAHDDLRAP
jgi:hypothetical protein